MVPTARYPQPRKTIAEPQDIDKLLAAAPRWMQAIILLASNAGLRRADCLRVAPIHYNPENKTLTIQMQKTGETLTVPATARLAEFLDHAPSGSPTTPYYQLFRDKPITGSGLDRAWQRLKRKAGANPDLWLHDLRRTVAVALYEVSKDLRVVEQMLGHQSLGSTVRYIEHRDPSKLKPYLQQIFTPKGPVQ